MFIRSVRWEDIPAFHAIRCMDGVEEELIAFPSHDIKASEAYIKGLGDQDHVLVAHLRNEASLVGLASLHINGQRRARHAACLNVMVHTQFQGRGIGRKLLESLVDLADHWLLLVRLEAEVVAGNRRAYALLQPLGFVLEGTRKCAWKTDKGYEDIATFARYRV